jgi:hypothetical protein
MVRTRLLAGARASLVGSAHLLLQRTWDVRADGPTESVQSATGKAQTM